MNFFPEPINPSEGRKKDHLIVNPIERDRQTKDNALAPQILEKDKILTIYGSTLLILKKIIETFTKHIIHTQNKTILQNEIISEIQKLKILIQNLQNEDQSKNTEFYQRLSSVWKAVHHYLQASYTQRKTLVIIDLIHDLIINIYHYPPSEDHNLGFYLTHYSGKEWLPIPFQDILKQLYTDHQINKNQSVLRKWNSLITKILQE